MQSITSYQAFQHSIDYPYLSHNVEKNLSGLLPEMGKDITKGLVEYALLLIAYLHTIEAVETGQLHKLDALVGENLCQVRALIIPLILKHCAASLLAKKQLVESILEKVKNLLRNPPRVYANLQNLLEQEGLEVRLSESELYLTELYLLTVIKKETGDPHRPESTYLPNIKNLSLAKQDSAFAKAKKFQIGSKFTDDLTKKLRYEVAKISAPFLRMIALQCGDFRSLMMLAPRFVPLIQGRECTPIYWSTKVIVQGAFQHGVPFVVWVKQVNDKNQLVKEFCRFYKKKFDSNTYKSTLPHLSMSNQPVIVVQALTKRSHRFEVLPKDIDIFQISDMILAPNALHRQYPDSREIVEIENSDDDTFHHYRKKGLEWKSMSNHLEFEAIRHIYCDRLDNIKPIKYKAEEYLEAVYGEFYRTCETAKLYELAKDLKIDITITTKGTSLIITAKSSFQISLLEEEMPEISFKPRKFLHKVPRVIDVSDLDENQMILQPDWEGFDPLLLAPYHDSPSKFLTDHTIYWNRFNTATILNFLSSNSEYLKNPEVLNIFAELIYHDREIYSYMYPIVKGLGKLMNNPELRKRATDLTITLASYNLAYGSEGYRSQAIKLLQRRISEPEIRAVLEKLLKEEIPISYAPASVRMLLESILEKIPPSVAWSELKNINQIKQKNDSIREAIFSGAKTALKTPEWREKIITLLLDLSAQTAPIQVFPESDFYSYRQFVDLCVGLNIPEYDNYDSYCQSVQLRWYAREALKTEIDDPAIRTAFEKMLAKETVPHLKVQLMNSLDKVDHHFEALLEDKIIDNLSSTWDLIQSYDQLQLRAIRIQAVTELIELILSPTQNKSLRLAAIRCCTQYFISMVVMYHTYRFREFLKDEEYEFAVEQGCYRRLICHVLKEITSLASIDEDVRNEASSLLAIIKNYLKGLFLHPISNFNAQASWLRKWIKEDLYGPFSLEDFGSFELNEKLSIPSAWWRV